MIVNRHRKGMLWCDEIELNVVWQRWCGRRGSSSRLVRADKDREERVCSLKCEIPGQKVGPG